MKARLTVLLVCGFCWIQAAAIDPASVIIVVNKSDDESIDLGYYYALKREVPLRNIVHLPLPTEEKVSWQVYLDQLYNPLMSWLLKGNWFSGFDSMRKDAIGRRIRLIDSHSIGAVVVCKGVPLQINNDPSRLPPKENYPEQKRKFYHNRASVDSELALLPFPKANIDGYFANPLYRRSKTINLFDVKPLVVGRLDGPSYERARGLIDNALKAEEEGIAGRAYIDKGGPHTTGDEWLEKVSGLIEEKGFDLAEQEDRNRFNLVDRFDEPLFYFGWYSGSIDGPFTHYDFKFPVGAIALHIHSYSASSIRSGRKHWVGPLVARGVTATFGNTSEPYLFLTHQPQFLMEGLFKGMTMGEAARYSIPCFSWAGVFVGDPLYLPPLGLKAIPKNEYDVLRTANRAKRAGDSSAYKAVVAEHNRSKHFSTGLWLYEYYLEREEAKTAYEFLRSIKRPSAEDPKNWGVLIAIAEGFYELGYLKRAENIFEDLLPRTKTKREMRLQLLQRGLKVSSGRTGTKILQSWKAQLAELTAPEDSKAGK